MNSDDNKTEGTGNSEGNSQPKDKPVIVPVNKLIVKGFSGDSIQIPEKPANTQTNKGGKDE